MAENIYTFSLLPLEDMAVSERQGSSCRAWEGAVQWDTYLLRSRTKVGHTVPRSNKGPGSHKRDLREVPIDVLSTAAEQHRVLALPPENISTSSIIHITPIWGHKGWPTIQGERVRGVLWDIHTKGNHTIIVYLQNKREIGLHLQQFCEMMIMMSSTPNKIKNMQTFNTFNHNCICVCIWTRISI